MSQRGRGAGLRAWASLRLRSCSSLALIASCTASLAPEVQAGLAGLERVASGAGGITALAQAPGDTERLFVVSQNGLIAVLNLSTGQFQPDAFLNLLSETDAAGEGGLLSLAFHPQFQTNGKFYVTVTVDNGGIVIDPGVPPDPPVLSPYTAHVREYTVSAANPNIANTQYANVLSWVKPQVEHTNGWLGFGPRDGYLYIATGDGGHHWDIAAGHTPLTGNAQDITDNLMGKLLRIDVNSDGFEDDPTRKYAIPADNPFVGKEGDDEIFAYGLRSPWKLSFDRATGDLWIGDVGEGNREEVDFIPAGSRGGQNFGWRKREGADPTPHEVGGQPPPANVHPVYDYRHGWDAGDPAFEGNSVTGGYVYRGPDPELQGKYIFADFISGNFWMFDPADPYGTVVNINSLLPPSAGQGTQVTTFHEDAVGNLYAGTLWGDVYRLVTDVVEPGDFQGDARVDGADLFMWQENFGGEEDGLPGDSDFDGDVDGADFLDWQRHLGYDAANATTGNPAHFAVPEPSGALLAAVASAMAVCFTNIAAIRTCRRGA